MPTVRTQYLNNVIHRARGSPPPVFGPLGQRRADTMRLKLLETVRIMVEERAKLDAREEDEEDGGGLGLM